MSRAETPITRLAPSPTGALHLGNARTFLINWAIARQNGWRILMRIEDLDGPRIKADAAASAIDILRWLGIDWDGEPTYQRLDLSAYHHALLTLHRKQLIYPCQCTRKEIEQAQSAPHAEDYELRYPGTCRPTANPLPSASALEQLFSTNSQSTAWRLRVPNESLCFTDQLHGRQTVNVQMQVGDFIVATKAGLPAYQLAVVVDDARQGVTDVIRGDDLLGSTARQLWLYRLLELAPLPRYTHLPLVLGQDGKRLAKRHGDTRITTYREQGVCPERIVGLLAYWSGVTHKRKPMAASEFVQTFDLAKLSRQPVTFTMEDEAWLTG